MTHTQRVDLLVALERHAAAIAAAQQEVLAAMAADAAAAADTLDPSGRGWVREDVSCALRLCSGTAQHRLDIAQTLVERLPSSLAMLRDGDIAYLQASNLSEAVENLDDEQCAKVEARVLARAPEQSLSAFRQAVRRAVASIATATVEEQREQAMDQRRVCFSPREDGMTELWALLPAESAAVIKAATDALATASPATDTRTPDQRRADALVDLAVAALHYPLLPKAHGMRPAIQVTVAASTLLGIDDQPGELAGHGPIPASVARTIAADPTGTWRRLLVDPPSGRLLDYGHTTYRPPRDLADHVMARDQTCRFPHCRRPAHQCHIDHRVPYDADGPTNPENLQVLCRRHHTAKHHAGWHATPHPDGTLTWTAATGHKYRSHPPHLPVGVNLTGCDAASNPSRSNPSSADIGRADISDEPPPF